MINFKKALQESCFCMDLQGGTKDAVIVEMVDALVAAGRITDRAAALHCVMERERKMSTGMQSGIAMPHGSTPKVTGLLTAFGVKKQGVEFGSMDGQPSKIFVMTISPANSAGLHMQYLAEMSKALNNPERRQRVLEAASGDDALRILTETP